MRYPYDLFIKFLITRKADVNATLQGLGLPELSRQEIWDKNILAGPLPPSVHTYLKSDLSDVKSKRKFLEWTQVHNIRELWEIQPEFLHSDYRVLTKDSVAIKKACEIFSDPKKRTALSLLIIREFGDEDIISILSDRLGYETDEETIKLAKAYFFNFSHLGPSDWNNLIQNLSGEERDTLALARKNTSREFAQHVIGHAPALKLEHILHDIMVTSYYKFKQSANQPLMDALAMRWADMAMQAGINKARYTGGDKRSLSEEIQMHFDFEEPEFPTLTDLIAPKPVAKLITELSTGTKKS